MHKFLYAGGHSRCCCRLSAKPESRLRDRDGLTAVRTHRASAGSFQALCCTASFTARLLMAHDNLRAGLERQEALHGDCRSSRAARGAATYCTPCCGDRLGLNPKAAYARQHGGLLRAGRADPRCLSVGIEQGETNRGAMVKAPVPPSPDDSPSFSPGGAILLLFFP